MTLRMACYNLKQVPCLHYSSYRNMAQQQAWTLQRFTVTATSVGMSAHPCAAQDASDSLASEYIVAAHGNIGCCPYNVAFEFDL
jgi:hypothetical protein